MKTRKYKIPVDVYESTLYLVLTDDVLKTEKDICRKHGWTRPEDIDESPDHGNFLYTDQQAGTYYIILHNTYDDKLIVHEAQHATFTILRHHGVTLSWESEEAFTYLLDYIFGKLKDKLK